MQRHFSPLVLYLWWVRLWSGISHSQNSEVKANIKWAKSEGHCLASNWVHHIRIVLLLQTEDDTRSIQNDSDGSAEIHHNVEGLTEYRLAR